MARGYRPVDRDQQFLMPPSLVEWLPSDHLVWFVLDVIAQFDTSGFHARSRVGGRGRAGFDPDLLLAVLVYAYAVGERSSRRIEMLCREHVAFQVLCGRDVPDHTVISRFRANHEDQFADFFAQVLVLCAQSGMGKLGVVAIDGTKIAANASIYANRTEDSLRNEADRGDSIARQAAQAAREIVAEAGEVDAAEDESYGDARGDELAPEFRDPTTRAAAIKAALAEIENEKNRKAAKAQGEAEQRAASWRERADAARLELAVAEQHAAERVRTWQEARDTAAATGGRKPGGPRPVLDSHSVRRARVKLARLQARAANAAASPRRAADAAKNLKANLTDPHSRIMNTRTGWVQGYNAQLAVSEDHLILAVTLSQDTNDIDCLVPMMTAAQDAATAVIEASPNPERPENGIGLIVADAGYCSEANLTTDGPERLIATGKDRKIRSGQVHGHDTTTAHGEAVAIAAMRERLKTPEGLAAYRRRGAIVEPVNAHLKDQIGLRRFSRRGLTAATSELNLAAAVTNLLKLHRHTTQPAT
jgi:transposase